MMNTLSAELKDTRGGGLVTKASGGYAHDGDTFVDAVNYCASLLAVKCVDLRAIAEVDEFFAAAVKPALTDRLDALAEFLPKFESPDFEFGRDRKSTRCYAVLRAFRHGFKISQDLLPDEMGATHLTGPNGKIPRRPLSFATNQARWNRLRLNS